MPTIADYLTSINASKTKLKSGMTKALLSPTNNLDAIVDLAVSDHWTPNPLWPDIVSWTPDGAIGFVMSNAASGKMSFKVSTTGSVQYTVLINDGATDISTTNYASDAQCDITMTPGNGTSFYRVKITSAAAITRFWVQRPTSYTETAAMTLSVLFWYANLTSLTSLAYVMYVSTSTPSTACALLEAAYIKSCASVSSMQSAFQKCYALRKVDFANTSGVTNMNQMFYGDSALSSLPATIDTTGVTTTGMSYMFYGCQRLKAIPSIGSFKATLTATTLFMDMCPAYASLDMSANTGATQITIGTSPGLRALLVSSSAPFSGASPQISIADCGLDHTALVALINSLPTVSGKTCVVKGNPGTASLTAPEIAVATGKGWTLTVA